MFKLTPDLILQILRLWPDAPSIWVNGLKNNKQFFITEEIYFCTLTLFRCFYVDDSHKYVTCLDTRIMCYFYITLKFQKQFMSKWGHKTRVEIELRRTLQRSSEGPRSRYCTDWSIENESKILKDIQDHSKLQVGRKIKEKR